MARSKRFNKKLAIVASIIAGVLFISAAISGYAFLWGNVMIEFYNEDGSLFSVQAVKPLDKVEAVHLASTEDKVFLGWFEDADDWDTYFLFGEQAWKRPWRSVKLYPKFATPGEDVLPAEQQALYDELVTQFGTVPEISITTESDPNIQKPLYAKGTLSLDCTADEFDLSNVKMEMRLRGRNSLSLPKKSYKIKFDKKNTSVFGQSGNKNWALVANYIDISNMRNYLAYTFASTLSFEFSPNCYFVNLTLNGESQGLYLLVESIEASPVRVDLQENPTAEDFDTGFILEEIHFITEPNFVENLDYIDINGHIYEIQYPKIDDDDIAPENYGRIITYIKNCVSGINDVIESKDFNRFSELCDVDSFVDFMVVQELFKNLDAYAASFYFYKKPGGKLTMGPVWDFDRSVGVDIAENLYYADGIYAEYRDGLQKKTGSWFYSLWNTPEFKTLFKQRVIGLYETEMQFIINLVEPTMFYIYDSAQANFGIWDIETALRGDERHTLKDLTEFGEQCGFVKYFLTARAKWLYDYCRE
ncbi:MAG: CotH kinase family protein [Clostridiales bacterium]|jgi:hypothetical protein|nr:CotH kinase family protein [Clostridiales bacterium]